MAFYRPNAGFKRDLLKPGDIFINTSTFKPAHCGIVVEALDMVHATGKGILSCDIDLWGQEAEVFRANPVMTKAETDQVTNIANEIKMSATYGVARAGIKSTFSTHNVGGGTRARLEKYRERLKNDQGVVKHVYCSELVILCYQLAWIAGDAVNEGHRLFVQLDGKHTWPSTLRRYLKANNNFSFLGEYKP